MTTTRHGYSAQLYIEGPWCDKEYDVEIEYTYTPGYPEQGPSWESGGEPASAPEVEVISLRWSPTGSQIDYVPLPKELWGFFDFADDRGRLWEDLVEDAENDRG